MRFFIRSRLNICFYVPIAKAQHLRLDFTNYTDIIWGFSYYFIKHSLVAFNPSQVASLRMVFSALALSPFLFKALKMIDRANYPMIFYVGFIGAFLPAFLYPFAQQKISSSSERVYQTA